MNTLCEADVLAILVVTIPLATFSVETFNFDVLPLAIASATSFIASLVAGSLIAVYITHIVVGRITFIQRDNLTGRVVGKGERDPSDDLRLQFETVSRMPEEERKIVKALFEGMIMKYQTKQLVGGLSS